MIELVFEGMCRDCKRADLELIQTETYDEYEYNYWDVHCKHENACNRILKLATDQKRGEQG